MTMPLQSDLVGSGLSFVSLNDDRRLVYNLASGGWIDYDVRTHRWCVGESGPKGCGMGQLRQYLKAQLEAMGKQLVI